MEVRRAALRSQSAQERDGGREDDEPLAVEPPRGEAELRLAVLAAQEPAEVGIAGVGLDEADGARVAALATSQKRTNP